MKQNKVHGIIVNVGVKCFIQYTECETHERKINRLGRWAFAHWMRLSVPCYAAIDGCKLILWIESVITSIRCLSIVDARTPIVTRPQVINAHFCPNFILLCNKKIQCSRRKEAKKEQNESRNVHTIHILATIWYFELFRIIVSFVIRHICHWN